MHFSNDDPTGDNFRNFMKFAKNVEHLDFTKNGSQMMGSTENMGDIKVFHARNEDP